jgi:hypothetical protein
MKLAIIAMLLTIVQTAAPISRQATDNSANDPGKIKHRSTNNQNPTHPIAPLLNPENTSGHQDSGDQPKADNTEHSIDVSKLPTVSIASGWRDDLSIVFTGLLVVIGSLGVCAAVRTLRAVERQADIMENSLKVVEAADVGIESASLIPVGAITPDSHIALRLKNFGRTSGLSQRDR